MNADEFVALLSERGLTVRRAKDGYMAQCPTHEDPTPSLHVSEGTDRVLVHCFGGCETPDVVSAVNRTMADLFHDANPNGPRPTHEPEPPRVPLPSDDEQKRAVAALAADRATLDRLARLRHWDADVLRRLGVGRGAGGRITFFARASDGHLVGVTEYDPDPKRRGPKSVSSGTRELFPPPEVVKAGDLWLTEGEPDVVTAYTLGMLAVGVPGAAYWAGARGKAAAERLRLRSRILILPDCDKPGREWAQRAGADLAELGVDARIVDLDPSRDDGYDLSDVLADAPDPKLARRLVESRAKHAKPIKVRIKGDATGWPNPLEPEAYHGLAGRIVRAFDPHTESDPAALLVQFLAAFGNAVGRQTFYLHENNRHTCALYVCVVGRSAKARKGTSWGRVESIMAKADPQWFDTRIVGGLSSGEGLIWEVRDPVVERVPKSGAPAEDVDDDDDSAWAEKIVDAGVDDKRLLIVESEFSQPLRVMKREGNTLSANLRNLWDRGRGGALTKNARTRTKDAHVSVIGHAVGDELRRELTRIDLENGFANRFLFVAAKRSRFLPFGGEIDEHTLTELSHEVATALDWARVVSQVSLAQETRSLWDDLYRRELGRELPGLLGAITARSEAYTIRLALIYALLDGSATISPAHLRAGVAVWRYCAASARFLFARTGTGIPDADRLLGILQEAGERGLTRTEITDALGRNWRKSRIDDALDVLERGGLAEVTNEETGGRPIERWRAT